MTSPEHETHASTAAAIIDTQGRVLMVQRRDSGDWEPPGGMLEFNETIEDGLVREVEEETGLLVEPEKVTGVYKNMVTGVINITFRCRVISGELRESKETSDFIWADPDNLGDLTTEVFALRLLDAYSNNGTTVRAHDGSSALLPRTSRGES